MATLSNKSSGTQKSKKVLKILKHLESAISDEGGEVIFECTISPRPKSKCAWYINGRKLIANQRVIITSIHYNSKIVHRLKINEVSSADQGIYTTCITALCLQSSSTANLLVANTNIKNGVVTYHHLNNKDVGVLEHVRNVKVEEGDSIELQATFLNDVIDYIWYKNNEQIAEDHRTIILTDNRLATLCISNSKVDDTGIYYVVAKAKEGTVSSFTNVLVLPVKEAKYKDQLLLPVIEDLPSQIDAFERDDVRVICKAVYHLNTKVEWHKVYTLLPSNFKAEEYGARCIGLRGLNLSLNDAGEYSVTLCDEEKGETTSSTCMLKIKAAPKEYCPPEVALTRALTSAMACLGSRALLRCRFAPETTRFLYVVWHVGIYRIERTNSRFSVLYQGGEFLLYIKAIEPEMAGSVVCELREALPDHASVRVTSSTARLDIVPLCVVEEEKKTNTSCMDSKLYDRMNPCVIKDTEETNMEHINNNLFTESVSKNLNEEGTVEEAIEIVFSLLDDEGLYFFQATKESIDVSATVTFLTDPADTIRITLKETIFPSNTWYSVELGQSDGSYVQSGISSTLGFQIVKPPVNTVIQILVRPVSPPVDSIESLIFIVPQKECYVTPMKSARLRDVSEFEKDYQKKEILGTGSYGSVELVRDLHGKFYAAKTLNMKRSKCFEKAKREYDIMKQLRHPQIIQLTEGFCNNNKFIIVMDCLWGGDLCHRIAEEEHIREEDVVLYVRQICEGLVYLHKQNIVHLDMKPENIVCFSPNSCQIKIIDFGIARQLVDNEVLRLMLGTEDYLSPEVINYEPLTVASDMWSVGVITYVLLSGLYPFWGNDWHEVTTKINRADFEYSDAVFENVSSLSKNFIDQLLVLNARDRMTAEQAMQHNWLKFGPPKDNAGCMRQTRENLKSYLANSRRKWQRAGNVMIAAHRLRVCANNLRLTSPN